MADEPTQLAATQTTIPLEAGHPPYYLPTVYSDGVANIAPSYQVVKFYFYRTDPEQLGTGPYKNQIVAQAIMSSIGFLQMATFFEKSVKHFIAQGTFQRDVVNTIRTSEGLAPFE